MTTPKQTPSVTLGDKGLELLMREVIAGISDYVGEFAYSWSNDADFEWSIEPAAQPTQKNCRVIPFPVQDTSIAAAPDADIVDYLTHRELCN